MHVLFSQIGHKRRSYLAVADTWYEFKAQLIYITVKLVRLRLYFFGKIPTHNI